MVLGFGPATRKISILPLFFKTASKYDTTFPSHTVLAIGHGLTSATEKDGWIMVAVAVAVEDIVKGPTFKYYT